MHCNTLTSESNLITLFTNVMDSLFVAHTVVYCHKRKHWFWRNTVVSHSTNNLIGMILTTYVSIPMESVNG